jgi:hypothetical protein
MYKHTRSGLFTSSQDSVTSHPSSGGRPEYGLFWLLVVALILWPLDVTPPSPNCQIDKVQSNGEKFLFARATSSSYVATSASALRPPRSRYEILAFSLLPLPLVRFRR